MVTMMGADIPMVTIRSQIASSIDIIVQLSRHSDGGRRVMSIAEVNGMEGDVITMQEIFSFHQRGKSETGEVLGELVYTGIRPQFMDRLTAAGVKLPTSVFDVEGGHYDH